MNTQNSLDKDKAIKSLDKLFDIFKEISFNADEIFKSRCPYKNAKARCTAKFECKNIKWGIRLFDGPIGFG